MAVDKNGKKLPQGIRQRSNGRYEGRIKYEYKSYSVYADTITETKKKMAELKYKLEHGIFVEKTKMTLSEWFKIWLEEYKRNRVKVGTLVSYRNYYDMIIKDIYGNKHMSDFRGEHIQKLYNDLLEEGYAISTIKIASAILNGCFEQAVRNGIIEKNPVKLADLPRQTEKKERQAMTKEQQVLFMKYAEGSYLYNFFAVLLRTGLRNGELRGLKYSDIDKKQGVIHVQRTLKYVEGMGYFEDTPKTRTSKRDVPLTADVMKLLDSQLRYWSFEVDKIDRYLFCNEYGEPLSRDRVKNELNRIISLIHKDGYEFPYITPHVFRHTFATRAIEAGMPPQVLKTILGHSSLAMTMDLYSHVMPAVKTEEMNKIASAF